MFSRLSMSRQRLKSPKLDATDEFIRKKKMLRLSALKKT